MTELKSMFESLRNDGYKLNPEINFAGFRGRITKSEMVWFINNMIKTK